MKKGSYFTSVFLLISVYLNAQSIQVNPGIVTDLRERGEFGSGKLEMDLLISGPDLANCKGLRMPTVLKAIDDAGNNLLSGQKKSDDATHPAFYLQKCGYDQVELELELQNPARTAKTIREISGTVEIYFPSKDPNAKVVFKDFMKLTGKPLVAPALKKAKAQLTILTKAQVVALEKEQEEKKSKAESLTGLLDSALTALFSGSMEENDLRIAINDPNLQIVDIEFVNADGEPIFEMGKSGGSSAITYSFNGPPPAGTQLVIYTATASSLKKLPFAFKNVSLP